ncbi:hypothetical protein EW146_g9201 [Bondarzewia mesenterica]|uniref:ABC transporter domain-containing protein n=1 Tax=Bondarzewia mesenterica TaxID=1095465 RepID=A0A4S4L859_9AGAM|nr:hypothetical protein EW146_g9201 [Bondarzewia mesenterica]
MSGSNMPLGSLLGGWQMKLALARVMLFKADILLLNEPTNHLDVVNVAWLENYLTSLTHCTSIIVSHDSDFLNDTITDILHLNHFKLRCYCTLEATEDYTFKLLDPPLLEGVKTKQTSLLKMCKVGVQYSTQPVRQLYNINITLQVSLSSYITIVSSNGSGKYTLIKLLTVDAMLGEEDAAEEDKDAAKEDADAVEEDEDVAEEDMNTERKAELCATVLVMTSMEQLALLSMEVAQ